jgi:adenine-specific DNA-methyltransferase
LQPFTPEAREDRLYNLVPAYLQWDNLQALPAGQRSLMILIIRKLLASSGFAIAGTFDTLIAHLQAKIAHQNYEGAGLVAEMEADYEGLDETREEWEETIDEEPLDDG